MREDFGRILRDHAGRYPRMEIQDFAKLAYQSEFGPRHLLRDPGWAGAAAREEWQKFGGKTGAESVELIGGGLCRFPLSACPSAEAVSLLTVLFTFAAREHKGTAEGLSERIDRIVELGIPGAGEWLEQWRQGGCPAVHHSQAYREAYHPHYRLLDRARAGYFPALWEIKRLCGRGNPIIVAVEGRCGSGKSGFARLVGQVFPCNIIHMDDFYLPPKDRPDNWRELPGGNMDFERFRREVLNPVREGRETAYRPYRCETGTFGEEISLPFRGLTVVEGSYCLQPSLEEVFDWKLFLTCSEKVQSERLRSREGEGLAAFEECWIPMEEHYFDSCKTRERCHMTVDTGEFFSDGET